MNVLTTKKLASIASDGHLSLLSEVALNEVAEDITLRKKNMNPAHVGAEDLDRDRLERLESAVLDELAARKETVASESSLPPAV